MTTDIQIFGGIREIGSTKVLIRTPHARVLLDIGLPIPDEDDPLRAPVVERPGHELADRLRLGLAPELPGIWDPAQLPAGSAPAARDPRPTAIFISHAHIDHDGCLGFVDPQIPVYAHPETVALHAALRRSGYRWLGGTHEAQAFDGPVRVGDITVEGFRVDHDVPGASGYLVTTSDGTLAYTGDINFHRDGSPHSVAFGRRIRGVDMLVTETTQLSFDHEPGYRSPSEDAVYAAIEAGARSTSGLALLSVYERDIERCAEVIRRAADWGRTVVWPGQTAVLLDALGVPGVVTWDETRPQTARHQAGLGLDVRHVGLGDATANPGGYLVQVDPRDFPALLDLPLRPGDPWIHSQGEPLGPFVPEWGQWQSWLDRLGVVEWPAGTSGHATPEELDAWVADVAPGIAVPLHGFRPEALSYEPKLIAEYGRRYDLSGRDVTEG